LNRLYHRATVQSGHSYLCRPRTFTLAADDQIEDGEVEAPRWAPIDQLRPEDIQSHCEIVLNALQKKDLPSV
jgi:hypothetical protein